MSRADERDPFEPAVVPLLRTTLALLGHQVGVPVAPALLENVLDRLEHLERHAPLADIADERDRQDAKWGVQSHTDGTGGELAESIMIGIKAACDTAHAAGDDKWALILAEELAEALAETDPVKLRAELVQVAAVATCWAEHIDRRTS